MIVAFIFIASALHIHASRHWISFRSEFKSVLTSNHGYVRVEDTTLSNNDQLWGWTNVILSYLWSEGHIVNAVVLNAKDNVYEPFDPKQAGSFKEFYSLGFPITET